jgi:hypothetical protein
MPFYKWAPPSLGPQYFATHATQYLPHNLPVSAAHRILLITGVFSATLRKYMPYPSAVSNLGNKWPTLIRFHIIYYLIFLFNQELKYYVPLLALGSAKQCSHTVYFEWAVVQAMPHSSPYPPPPQMASESFGNVAIVQSLPRSGICGYLPPCHIGYKHAFMVQRRSGTAETEPYSWTAHQRYFIAQLWTVNLNK